MKEWNWSMRQLPDNFSSLSRSQRINRSRIMSDINMIQISNGLRAVFSVDEIRKVAGYGPRENPQDAADEMGKEGAQDSCSITDIRDAPRYRK